MTARDKITLDVMTPEEHARRSELEETIQHGIRAWIDGAAALTEIRDARLYRGTHATFEDYCEQVWKFSRARAYQLIYAAEIAQQAVNHGLHLPNERSARALAGVPAADLRLVAEVVRAAAGTNSPTSAQIQAVADTVRALNERAHIEHPATGEQVHLADLTPEQTVAAAAAAVKRGAGARSEFQGTDDTPPLKFADGLRESGTHVEWVGTPAGYTFTATDQTTGERLEGKPRPNVYDAVRAWRAMHDPTVTRETANPEET